MGHAPRIVCLFLALVLALPSFASAERLKSFKLKTLDGVEKTLPDVLGKATLVSSADFRRVNRLLQA